MTNLYDSPHKHWKYPKTKSKTDPAHIRAASKRAQCLGSLLRSIAKAGGAVDCFFPRDLDNKTVMELIELSIGQNDIKFFYDGGKSESQRNHSS